MEVEIIKSGTGAAEITVNGSNMLAVITNLSSKIYKQISRQELLSEPGILIEGGISNKWECTESLEYEGKLIFPGPLYSGNTLADIDPDIEILLKLALAFQTVISENLPVTGFYPPGIFISTDGGTLIFPPALINYITGQLSESESMEFWQPYNHPDANGEVQFSFILGVLTYKLLTDTMPYTGSSITEIREKMRSSQPVGVELLKPGIKESISALTGKSLSLKNVKLEDWISQFKLWQKEGPINAIGEEEQLHLQKSAARKQTKRQRQFERRQFFSRNWKALAAAVAALVFVVSFSIGPIKNALKPPVTIGMSAEEVVGTYYSGIIDMDVEIMEDCVDKGIGKSDIQEVTQLFVISRVRTGYEGQSGLISAQDWNDGVITTLNPGEQVYGIADLELIKIDESSFQADYIRWYPNIPDDADSNEILPPTKAYVRDTLTLGKVKDVWIIVSLERQIKE